jgi:16S rRNA (uracil1498-N3)-methyltransferase
MNDRCFWIEPGHISGNQAVVHGPEAHHIHSVLRLSVGTKVTLLDGAGGRYLVRLERINKDQSIGTILSHDEEMLPGTQVHLAQGLLKGQKMELVIQKATELGIGSITPFISRFCQSKIPSANKEERWERIVIEACKQCNRARKLDLRPAMDFAGLLATGFPHCQKILFWEGETNQDLTDFILEKEIRSVLLLIGPEGGLSIEEAEAARKAGFHTISLGKRILRAETASITAMGLMQFLTNNLTVSKGI